MTSIRSNLSALTALQALNTTQTSFRKTQEQISTGLRVKEAADNASYWSIGVRMRSDVGTLGAVKDSIRQSVAMLDTFTSALDKTLASLNKIKQAVVSALQPGADVAAIQNEISAQIKGLKNIAGSATINGQNWLSGPGGTANLVVSYDGAAHKVNTLAFDTSQTKLFADVSAGVGGILGDVAAFDVANWVPSLRLTGSQGNGGSSLSNPVVKASPANASPGLVVIGTSGDDNLLGGSANDTLVGGPGDDILNGRSGTDEMRGGPGNDYYVVHDETDIVVEMPNEGHADRIESWVPQFTLPANVEILYLAGTSDINGAGNELDNRMVGNLGANILIGASGNDELRGGAGNDILVGGMGKDTLLGGAGTDTFVFTSAADTGLSVSEHDVISDWESVDRLDLSGIDADTKQPGHQNHVFVGQGAANDSVGAGQVKYFHDNGHTYVVGDVSGDGKADFKIAIAGIHTLYAESSSAELYPESLKAIDKAIESVIKGSASLGATKALLEMQAEFIGVMSDALIMGVGAFVDADMDEASVRFQALQTQQKLGAQALAIANQNSQIVLKLLE